MQSLVMNIIRMEKLSEDDLIALKRLADGGDLQQSSHQKDPGGKPR